MSQPKFENIDYDVELDRFSQKLDQIDSLIRAYADLNGKDQSFAASLITTFQNTGGLSAKQWDWVGKLAERAEGVKPLYGNFKAIQVAFMLAGEHLKYPKIRLLTDNDRFVQLNFYPETKTIKVFVDGWQGHGYRKFAGVIEDDMIKPYSSDRFTPDVHMAIESLANDPVGASKAFANKLGACIYCGQRLSDPVSKEHGYGATCASHYGLPHGKNKPLKVTKLTAVN